MQTTDYHKQAEDFLTKHGIKFRATLSDSKVAPWKKEGERTGHHYRVTLSKDAETKGTMFNNSHKRAGKYYIARKPARLVFDFWASIADAEKGIETVTPYDVLACISSDAHCAETFPDFCSEFAESEDSIKALQTFRRCSAFGKRLRAFFTEQEIEELSEIQ